MFPLDDYLVSYHTNQHLWQICGGTSSLQIFFFIIGSHCFTVFEQQRAGEGWECFMHNQISTYFTQFMQ